ncbi:hypothetical protein GCM10009526_11700 [Glutamicibacter creatinolyticus]
MVLRQLGPASQARALLVGSAGMLYLEFQGWAESDEGGRGFLRRRNAPG